MTAGLELRKLKTDIATFECLNYQDLKFYAHKITRHIRLIFETHPVKDVFLNNYIQNVVIKHIEIVEDYIDNLNDYKGKEAFVSKALKYHFNCITDSFTYATLINQHD